MISKIKNNWFACMFNLAVVLVSISVVILLNCNKMTFSKSKKSRVDNLDIKVTFIRTGSSQEDIDFNKMFTPVGDKRITK